MWVMNISRRDGRSSANVEVVPEERHAADEHALLAEVTEPLAGLPLEPPPITAQPDFPIVRRGYDRAAVDAYVRRTGELLAELGATQSPDAAVRRALERVGEQIAGILQRAHDTAAEITADSRREAEDRLIAARREAEATVAEARGRLEELDAETDRVWGERERIVEEIRALAQELLRLTESAAAPVEGAEPPLGRAGARDAAEPADPEPAEPEPEPQPPPVSAGDPDATAPLPATHRCSTPRRMNPIRTRPSCCPARSIPPREDDRPAPPRP